ncbi:putative malonyl-CoA-acyl carrier protein transacylase, mitochondrial, partial [Stegodyphus mimosarum]
MRRLTFFRTIKRTTWYKGYFRKFHTSMLLNDQKLGNSHPDLKAMLVNSASFSEQNAPDDEWITPVYPAKIKTRDQSKHAIRPQVDPRTTSVVLFPGQGTQYVGMAKSLISYPNVKQMFECASDILRYNLLDLCLNGPQDMLDMTVHSQVAVMVASLAAVEKMRAEALQMVENCVATAGFSVGEYSALVFAGSLEFESAIRLLKIRGEAMQAASELQPSGMMTVFLSNTAKIKQACATAREWCEQQGISNPECKIAIYMFPDCRVISGHLEALKFLELHAAEFGITKIKYIPVSGAFHSKLMQPARKVLEKALKATKFEIPLIPVHSNVDGKPYRTVEKIQENLALQLCKPVAWEQTMHVIFERAQGTTFPNVFECGPGTSLKAILRYNNGEA